MTAPEPRRYAMPGHNEDGRTWEEYFREYGIQRRAARAERAEESPEDAPQPFVPLPAVEMEDPTTAPGKPGQIAKRLGAQGWEVTIRTVRTLVPAVLRKTASKEGAEIEYSVGDVRIPRHALRWYALVAVKRAANGRIGLVLDGTWTRRAKSLTFISATTYDPLDGVQRRTGIVKPRARHPSEPDDFDPPGGLDEWLHDFAPTKQSIDAAAKKQKAAAAAAAESVGMWDAAA